VRLGSASGPGLRYVGRKFGRWHGHQLRVKARGWSRRMIWAARYTMWVDRSASTPPGGSNPS